MERDVFLLHCCIYLYLFYLFTCPVFSKKIYALLEDHLRPFLSDTFTKVHKVARITWISVLKIYLSPKMLKIRTVNISLHNSHITKIISLLKEQKSSYCPDRDRWSANFSRKRLKILFQTGPVIFFCQQAKFMLRIYETAQNRFEHF